MKGAPGSFLGGAPRRCGSASVVQRPRGSGGPRKSRNSCARARDGGGGWFSGCLVGGRWGEGGGEVRWFCGDGFEMVVRGCVVFERVVFEGGGGK